jgi:uncharacterized protein YciI
MQFVWMGFIKDGAERIPQEVNAESTEFLSQPYLKIQSVGPLCDENKRRAGMLMIFEADDRTAAEALVKNSPYLRAGIYEKYQLYEFHDEIG